MEPQRDRRQMWTALRLQQVYSSSSVLSLGPACPPSPPQSQGSQWLPEIRNFGFKSGMLLWCYSSLARSMHMWHVARALHCKPSSDGVPEYIRRQILVCTMSDIIQIMLYCPMPVAFPSAATDKQTEFCAAIFLPPLPLSRMFPKKTLKFHATGMKALNLQ